MISSDDPSEFFHIRGVETIGSVSDVTHNMVIRELTTRLADHIIRTKSSILTMKVNSYDVEYNLDCIVLSWHEYNAVKRKAFEEGMYYSRSFTKLGEEKK